MRIGLKMTNLPHEAILPGQKLPSDGFVLIMINKGRSYLYWTKGTAPIIRLLPSLHFISYLGLGYVCCIKPRWMLSVCSVIGGHRVAWTVQETSLPNVCSVEKHLTCFVVARSYKKRVLLEPTLRRSCWSAWSSGKLKGEELRRLHYFCRGARAALWPLISHCVS